MRAIREYLDLRRQAAALHTSGRCIMARRDRRNTASLIFHVLNRAVENVVLFAQPADYEAFLGLLKETERLVEMRLLAYVLMPTHWHLVLWPPADQALSGYLKHVTATHALRCRRARGSSGRGALYQARFKAIAVQDDGHLLTVCRYVERNPLRARLTDRAEHWPWGSASPSAREAWRPTLTAWPVDRPDDWSDRLNTPEPPRDLTQVRDAVRNGLHYGTECWRSQTASALHWRGGLRARGRPGQTIEDSGTGGITNL